MGVYNNFGNTMNDMVDQVLESHTFNNSRITPMAELLAGDLVRLIPGQSSHVDWVISARLAYEPNFSNLNQSAVLSFANLVVLATKAFIYNELIISLDEVSTMMGVEINTVKQIIESYAEADKEYDEMLTEQFTGGAQLDPRRMAILFNHML